MYIYINIYIHVYIFYIYIYMHSFGEFCAISPKPIFSLCSAAHSRFAKAEDVVLRKMQSEALILLGDCNSLSAHASSSIPSGFFGGKPLIQNLFDSLGNRAV